MTRADRIKFRLAPVAVVLFAALVVFAFSLLPSASTRPRQPQFLTYGFYNMQTLQFTMQSEWNQQLQSQGSKVTVLVSCSRVLVDTAVCHGTASNGQVQDVGVQITRRGNDFKVSQYR